MRADLKIVSYGYAGPTIEAFHKSDDFVRLLMGPIGAGKSVACVMELLWRAGEQAPGPDGIRRTRWAIIRSTYPELQTTTLRTFQQWVPGEYGTLRTQPPMSFHMRRGDIDVEFLFLALDREDDVRKLLSLELTGAWINEAREIPKSVFEALTGRVGRFPRVADGGPTWSGIIMDTNPPDTEHWLYHLFEGGELPAGYSIFKQPSGVSPQAENRANLPANYYERLSAGKDDDWLRVYVHGEYGFVREGLPVFGMFRDSVHTAPEPLRPVEGLPIMLGVDFGLTPAAVFGQRLPDGRWHIFDEFVCDDAGVIRFTEGLTAYIRANYPNHFIGAVFGDPAGNIRSQNDEKTALEILREHTGWKVRPAPSNEWVMRREVVVAALNRMIDGRPGFTLSPKCPVLRKGFSGGYHYRPIRASITGRAYDEKPLKNEYSHPHDALQYLMLGGGDADVVMNRVRRDPTRRRRSERVNSDYSLFGYRADDENDGRRNRRVFS
jgi:hypothetical protein